MSLFDYPRRRLVCSRCHVVMDDHEPASKNGEFWHPRLLRDKVTLRTCVNVDKAFYLDQLKEPDKSKEIELFQTKRERRTNKRNGVRPNG